MESREGGKAIFAAQALIYHARQEEGHKFGRIRRVPLPQRSSSHAPVSRVFYGEKSNPAAAGPNLTLPRL